MKDEAGYATTTIDSPIGRIALAATSAGLTQVQLRSAAKHPVAAAHPPSPQARAHVQAAARALAEYFAGRRREFDDLVLAPCGTPFQLRTWRALQKIPFGGTNSYGDVARRIRQPRATRAVGMANNRNPMPIIIPCHRVIGADGSLTGYGGGLRTKAWLLRHERAVSGTD